MLFDLEEELKKLPASPGVYLMHNNRDEIIYVGKAISLKNRASIFRAAAIKQPRSSRWYPILHGLNIS